MVTNSKPYLTPQEGWRLHYDPEAKALLQGGRLLKWHEPLLALIAIYMVHRYSGGLDFHSFRFREDSGRRVVISVTFAAEWARVTGIEEEDSIEVA